MLAAAVLFLLLFSQGDRQQQQKEARESSVRGCPGFLIHLYVASIEKHASSRRNFGTSLFTHLRKIYVAMWICHLFFDSLICSLRRQNPKPFSCKEK